LPWDGRLGRDEKLKQVHSAGLVKGAAFCLEHLDDYAVFILFSVFESAVRAEALSEIEAVIGGLGDALVGQIVAEATEAVRRGSFSRVLGVYRVRVDSGLLEEVNQVRKYRNWVAHGRRRAKPESVLPETAFSRLKRFLASIDRTSH
jgi:hypothetical protein